MEIRNLFSYNFDTGREVWADYTKGIGILLMEFSHVYYHDGALLDFIFSFHVPLFFVLSGYFAGDLRKKNIAFKDYFLRNVHTLIVPYLFFYLLALPFGFYIIYSQPGKFHYENTFDIFRRLIVGMLLVKNGTEYTCTNLPTWFISSLFICRILYYCTKYCSRQLLAFILFSIVSLLLFIIAQYYSVFDIWHFQEAFLCFPLYLVGRILNKYHLVQNLMKCRFLLLLSVTLGLVCFVLGMVNGSVNVFSLKYGNSILLFIVVALLGTLSVSVFSMQNFKSGILAFVGSNSLIILGCHASISRIVRGIFSAISGTPIMETSLINSIIIVIIVTILQLPIIILFNRYCPSLVGKKCIVK